MLTIELSLAIKYLKSFLKTDFLTTFVKFMHIVCWRKYKKITKLKLKKVKL